MKPTFEHKNKYPQDVNAKLTSEEQDHLMHLATTPFNKRVIPEEHLDNFLKIGYLKHTLGGHTVTDKGHMKLMYEGE